MSLKAQSQRDKYLFDIQDYKIVREVKKGGFGVINLVRNKKNGKEYAAKTNLIPNSRQNKLFISREVRILMKVQHPTIIEFQGFSYLDFDAKKNITILMNYMNNGSLADLISKEEKSLCPKDYDNTKRQKILIGIARGMMILHKLRIIHRDLKPENILLDDDFNPHITDFGLSKFFDPGHSMSQSISYAGTVAYMAPEVLNGTHFNTKADVYAFGILMYEVLTGKRAYTDLLKGKKKISPIQFGMKVCNEGLRPEIEASSMKKSHAKMIEKCWSQNPRDRPTFSELYRKLSLVNEDEFIEFEDGGESNVISDDDDDEIDDGEEEEENIGFSTKFCLKSVDYNEILDYVDEISVESKSAFKESEKAGVNDHELEELKKEMYKLREITNNLREETCEKIIAFKNETCEKIHELEMDFRNKLAREIYDLKNETKFLKQEIEELKEKVQKQEEIIRTKSENKEKSKQRDIDEHKSVKSSEENKQKDKDKHKSLKNSEESKQKEFPYEKGKEFDGIINYLTNKTGSNIHDNGTIEVTSNSILNDVFFHPKNLFNFNKSVGYYSKPDDPDAWICFDFKKMKIQLSHYSIKSRDTGPNSNHIKSWVMETSNDMESWTPIDQHSNYQELNGCSITQTFAVSPTNASRYCRLRCTGSYFGCGDNNSLVIVSIEFYGKLDES